jgi:hypothetical protein
MMITLTGFLLFAAASIGMTHIIVDSSLFQAVRDWIKAKAHPKIHEMLTCYQCCGFWVGLFSGYFVLTHDVVGVFLCGCASSFLSQWAAIYLNFLEAKMVVANLEE